MIAGASEAKVVSRVAKGATPVVGDGRCAVHRSTEDGVLDVAPGALCLWINYWLNWRNRVLRPSPVARVVAEPSVLQRPLLEPLLPPLEAGWCPSDALDEPERLLGHAHVRPSVAFVVTLVATLSGVQEYQKP